MKIVEGDLKELFDWEYIELKIELEEEAEQLELELNYMEGSL